MSMAQVRAELLTDVMAHVEATLRELGIEPSTAMHAGHAVADMLAQHWGGQVVSYPVDHAYKLSLREREILEARAKGATPAELAFKYHMTTRGISILLKRAQRRHVEDAQIDLFATPEPPK